MGNKVTVRDVAAAAGVSPATASRVLSGYPSVNPEMARRVTEASTRLGYSANVFARALRTRRTDTVGMVVPSIGNPYFVGAVEAVEGVLSGSGRSLILCDSRDSVATEAARVSLLLNRMVDGLVVIPVSAEESAPALRAAAAQSRVVQLDRIAEGARTDFVGADDYDGVHQCIDHLRDRGCRTIAYIGARPTTSTAAQRLRAFEELTRGDGGTDAPVYLGEFSAGWGAEAARHLLEAGPLPDAIVCGADVIAVSVLTALRGAGVEVPVQVKVVSYDDSGLGLLTVPRLTSVRQPLDVMAQEAIRLLDTHPEDGAYPPRKSIFAPQLVIRDSTGLT
ncbi:LacI family DNA-binding transcriptional regulator [Georgenia sp. SYP-B2076]|uniref:LacI family DNA-binding transcriptional regulator n=1 Tax=Georgenia sp. SYP-B2076 TaxID=2495881 RepID=UPI0013DF94C7|nr:LacI family DNA-binding transcriptional regulator [Georgenia sp. SYP-B2076]